MEELPLSELLGNYSRIYRTSITKHGTCGGNRLNRRHRFYRLHHAQKHHRGAEESYWRAPYWSFFRFVVALIPQPSALSSIIVYSLAVGISIFLMVALDAEHPPAGGTALGVAITGFSPNMVIAVLTSSIVLSLAHRFSKRFLKDLT